MGSRVWHSSGGIRACAIIGSDIEGEMRRAKCPGGEIGEKKRQPVRNCGRMLTVRRSDVVSERRWGGDRFSVKKSN
jgi:hypothetical protein